MAFRLPFPVPMRVTTSLDTSHVANDSQPVHSIMHLEMFHISPAIAGAAMRQGIDLEKPVSLAVIVRLVAAMESEL